MQLGTLNYQTSVVLTIVADFVPSYTNRLCCVSLKSPSHNVICTATVRHPRSTSGDMVSTGRQWPGDYWPHTITDHKYR